MRILVEPGSHHLLNVGDAAMLEVCVDRLRRLFPGARIEVATGAPERLRRLCPGAEPVPAEGRYRWLGELDAPDWEPRRGWPGRIARAASRLGPSAGRRALRLESRLLRRESRPAAELVEAVSRADLLVMSGRGWVTDAFRTESLAALELLDAAIRAGVPTALMGQGIGPIVDLGLRSRAAEVLPGVGLIALREGRAGPALLGDLGVVPGRVAVTGDDAIETAHGLRPSRHGGAIGVSVRAAPYSGVGDAQIAHLRAALARSSARLGAALVSVPVSRHPAERDGDHGARLGAPAPVASEHPAAVVGLAGACRLVVTGSYHAGVFALSQGVPVVGLFATPYYRDKLAGLAHQFGTGCELVAVRGPTLDRRLERAITSAWEEAGGARGPLLDAAERQMAAAAQAYARLPGLAGRSSRASIAGPRLREPTVHDGPRAAA